MVIHEGEIKKQRDLEYLKLFFIKRLIQRIPLNRFIRFNFNNLKVLEH